MDLLRIRKILNFVLKWKIWCCHHKDILEYLQQQGDLQVENVKLWQTVWRLARDFFFYTFMAGVDPLY